MERLLVAWPLETPHLTKKKVWLEVVATTLDAP